MRSSKTSDKVHKKPGERLLTFQYAVSVFLGSDYFLYKRVGASKPQVVPSVICTSFSHGNL